MLTLITPRVRKQGGKWMHEYLCACGNKKVIFGSAVIVGNTKSCGCLRKVMTGNRTRTHGFSKKERVYNIWKGMKNRCLNKNSPSFKNYGQKGIKVCDDWLNYSIFRDWAINNGYADTLTIERKDNSLGYSPDNCKWITKQDQGKNTSRVVPKLIRDAIIQDCKIHKKKDVASKYGVSKVTVTKFTKRTPENITLL